MVEQGSGVIINASKGGVEAFTRAVPVELVDRFPRRGRLS